MVIQNVIPYISRHIGKIPYLKNILKFHTFPGFPYLVRTLLSKFSIFINLRKKYKCNITILFVMKRNLTIYSETNKFQRYAALIIRNFVIMKWCDRFYTWIHVMTGHHDGPKRLVYCVPFTIIIVTYECYTMLSTRICIVKDTAGSHWERLLQFFIFFQFWSSYPL